MLAKDVSVNDLLYRQYEFSKDVRSLQQLVVSYKAYSGCHLSETLKAEIFSKTMFLKQGSHKLWTSWKTWKITKKSSMHGKVMEFEKT